MKKLWKKSVAGVLAVFTIAGSILTGCGGTTSESQDQESAKSQTENELESNISSSSEPDEVVFRFANYGPTITDLQTVEDAMNKILIPKINCKIKLDPVDGSNYNNQMNLDLSSGTRIDLAMTAGSYNTAIAQNQIQDITELLEEYGKEAKENVGEKYLKGVTVNGKIYGLPNVNGRASVIQFAARTDILEKYNLSLDGIKQVATWEEQNENLNIISEILKTVKENEPDIVPLIADQVGNVRVDELISKNGLSDDLGVLLGKDSTEVVNYYATEEFKECTYLLRDWYNLGYIMKDVSTTTESASSLLASGIGFSVFTNSEIGYDAQLKNSTGYDFTCVKMSLPLVTSVNGITYSVPVTAANPVASVKVLNELYSNPDIATLLTYGVQDIHYVLTEDGKAAYPEGVDANTSTYSHSNFWALPNQLIALEMEGTVTDYNKILKENNETADVSKVLGFTFDNSNVQTETAACTAVVDEYKKGLKCGSIDVDKNLPEFLQKLKDAGIDTIIAEKQKQLDQWLKDNGVQ
mgnify:CR=1 FL=1